MIVTNGLEISGKDYFGRREDLSFIVRFHWKTSNHLKEAIQVLLASRLDEHDFEPPSQKSVRKRSDVLDESEFRQIRLQIASNPHTPPAVLSYLSKQGDAKIQERIAENPRTPTHTLERLAASPIATVRASVAENVNASPDILTLLGNDKDDDVRYRLAENPHLPEEMLVGLTEDHNPYVAARAQATLDRLNAAPAAIIQGDFFRAAPRERGWHIN